MPEKKTPIKMNISLSLEVAAELMKFSFESTGQMSGVSEAAEKAIREYLGKHGIKFKRQV